MTLIAHVNNAYGVNHPRAGQQTKHDSQWVSTGAYDMVKTLDPTFAQQVFDTHLYKIDTTAALATGGFHDVNDAFDKAAIDRPYSTQREWLKVGGIPQNAVTEYMAGRDFMNQYDIANNRAPDESSLTGWLAF